MAKPLILISALILIFSDFTHAQQTSSHSQAEELGKVRWYRNYDLALEQARKMNKSVLILFQEVPGCATCRNYGHNVLSHPLMVEAIEDQFIPLAIFNNKGGEDARILKLYHEPSWNNPVVRIVDGWGKNLVDRVSGNYSAKGLFQAMETALEKEHKPLPGYMKILKEELFATSSGQLEEMYYKMYCFWSGEGHLGKANGVVATEPGFIGGHEVVKVTFNQGTIRENELTDYAARKDCQPIAGKSTFRPDKDPQYYLKQTDYKYLPLTPLQKTKINSAIANRESPESFLSPRQSQWLKEAKSSSAKREVLYTEDFANAWEKMTE